MKALSNMFPAAVFLIALILSDVKVATAALIVAMVIQTAWLWFRHRHVERMHIIMLGIVLVFGGLTLALNDVRFIKWKPSIVNWLFAATMLFLQFVTSKGALERMLGSQMRMPRHAWNKLNFSWAIFFILVGLLNLYVAFVYGTPADPLSGVYGGPIESAEVRDRHWGYFKVVGLMVLTMVFAIASFAAMARHIQLDDDSENNETPAKQSDDSKPA